MGNGSRLHTSAATGRRERWLPGSSRGLIIRRSWRMAAGYTFLDRKQAFGLREFERRRGRRRAHSVSMLDTGHSHIVAPPSPGCNWERCQHPRSQFLLPISPLSPNIPFRWVSLRTCATAPGIKASNSGGLCSLFGESDTLLSYLAALLAGWLAAERPREGRQKKRKLTHNNTDALPSPTKSQMALIPRHLPLQRLKVTRAHNKPSSKGFLLGGGGG